MAKSYSEWSARAKELGRSGSYASYLGYLNNLGESAPAPAPSPAPVIKATAAQPAKQLSGRQAANVAMEERKAADASPSQASFTTIHGSQGVTNPVFAQYAQKYPDLMADYNLHWKKGAPEPFSQNNEGISLAEYGAMHYAKYGREAGRTLGAESKVAEESGGGGGGPAITEKTILDPANAPTGESYKEYESKGIYSDKLEPVKPELAKVQITGPESQVVEERVKNLVDTNSPLFRAAAGQAYRQLASRGLANSSLANQAVMDAILSVAVPIASADAETFKQQSVLNQGFSNEFRAAQNAAYYNQESQKLDGIIREVLANISGEYSVKTAEISAEASKYATDISAAIAAEENRIKAAEIIANQQTPTGAKTTADLIYNKTPNANVSNFTAYYKTQ